VAQVFSGCAIIKEFLFAFKMCNSVTGELFCARLCDKRIGKELFFCMKN